MTNCDKIQPTGDICEPRSLMDGVREILKVAIPSSLSMMSFTLMHFFDGLMVARIRPGGPEALSAQFAGGFSSFILISFFVGLLGMVGTFVSQNLGAKRDRQCGHYAWAGIYIALVASGLLLCLMPLADSFFALVGHASEVQALETMYFRYMLAMTPFLLTAKTIENYFFGLHRAVLVFAITLASNILNLAGNYVLIFGKFGAPSMGLEGAAISTCAANCFYCAMFAVAFMARSEAMKYATRDFLGAKLSHVKDILRIGWPSGLQFFMDMFSWGACMIFLTGMVVTVNGQPMEGASTIHLSASNVVMRYLHISFMPAVGLGIAASVVVGRHIGAGRRHLAASSGWTAWSMGIVYMGLCGAVFFLFGSQLTDFFVRAGDSHDLAATVQQRELIVLLGAKLFAIAALFQIFDATAIIMTGALKGAGDTMFPMLMSAIGGLVVGFGGGWVILQVFPQLESSGIWLAGAANVILLGIACMWRFVSGRWRKIDLLTPPTGVH